MNDELDYNIELMRYEVLTETDYVTLFILEWAYNNPEHLIVLNEMGIPLSSRDVVAKLAPIFIEGQIGDLHPNSSNYRINSLRDKKLAEVYFDKFIGKTHIILYRPSLKGRRLLDSKRPFFEKLLESRLRKFYQTVK